MFRQMYFIIGLLLSPIMVSAQADHQQGMPYFNFKNGLGITSPDSNFTINIRFRIQNRFLMNTVSQSDWSPASWEARVRRARLSFTGFVFDPSFSYYLQLSFSRGDQDWNGSDLSEQNTSPNIVRDAMLFYRPNPQWQFAFGQGKLPGNRQRVVSSGALQFFDRSPLNAAFTLDRDFGFFATYKNRFLRDGVFLLKTAITSGEGRNSISSNSGLAYTARLELLPLGEFTSNGDYFEGDVLREPMPKISIGLGGHYNDLAVRTQGQLGRDLYYPRSFYDFITDFLFKYRGFALTSEYIYKKSVGTPVTMNASGSIRDLLVGQGINTQVSYCLSSAWEFAGRHSLVIPDEEIKARTNVIREFGIGVTKYLRVHKTKAQFNIFSRNETNEVTGNSRANLYFVFQVEAGI